LKKIPFFKHDLGKKELCEIQKVFHGPILTTGKQVERFEKQFSKYLGCFDTVACTSWTGAAHIALLGLGIRKGDEVILSPFTFVASATAIIQAGAIPKFVDCEKETGNIDAKKIEQAINKKTKCIMPIHLYGQMCDMVAIHRIAKKHNLRILEDAAHCIEGCRDGIRPGQLSDMACFSFFATKNLACGEGGAVSFNDIKYSSVLRKLRLHGITKTSADREKEGYKEWDMPAFGWKYNMDNIHAAILLAQFKKFNENRRLRKIKAIYYRKKLKRISNIRLFKEIPNSVHAWHLMVIQILSNRRNEVIEKLKAKKIFSTVNYRPVHKLTYFKNKYKKNYANAEDLGRRVLSLPFYPKITKSQIDLVCEHLRHIMES
jgi:UDP-4-amino-4-deoxy-L-arabinose-oxoglutarate aminotransferase